MGFPFPEDLKEGDPLAKISGDDIRTVYRILNHLSGVNCYVEKDADGSNWKVVVADPTGTGNRPIHPFEFRQTSATGGTVEAGLCFIGGEAYAITNLPAILSSVTTTTYYWIEIDLTSPAAEWKSGAAWPTGWGDEDTDIWPILALTCAGSILTGVKQHQCSDIHTPWSE